MMFGETLTELGAQMNRAADKHFFSCPTPQRFPH